MPQTQVLITRRLDRGAGEGRTASRQHKALAPRTAKAALYVTALTAVVGLLAGVRCLVASRAIGSQIGQVLPDFGLVDVRTCHLHRLSDHEGRVVVIIFTGARSALDDANLPRLSALSAASELRRIDFIAINSDASESIEEVAEHARRLRVTFPVLKDPANRVADLLGARNLYEVLVIDDRRRVRYRGAIEGQIEPATSGGRAPRHYLALALDAVLAGRPVSPERTAVMGEAIERRHGETAK
jgi:peroxiredoxin